MSTIFSPVIALLAITIPFVLSAETTSVTKHKVDVSPDQSLCTSGKNQSPINIDSEKTLYSPNRLQRGLKFNYGLITPETITNTGHGIRIKVGKGTNIKVDGIKFELKYLDIHMPSENTVNNKHFPMEIQFVHENSSKENTNIAIVSQMYIPGKADRTLRKLLKQLPEKAGEPLKLAANTLRNFEQKKKIANYYRYDGSLTTPPCSEGVRWFIMKQPLTLSNEQQLKFKTTIGKENNRPVQELNARKIME
jgi:carbonic anhydrase